MDSLNIPILIGTARKGRRSEPVANYIFERAKAFGFKTKIIDIENYLTDRTYKTNDSTPEGDAWKKLVSEVDGLIIVTPEYNHSFPGELKILLDKAYKEYNNKAVGLCTVSNGGMGGARVAEHLLSIMNNFKLATAGTKVYFSNVLDLIDDSDKITEDGKAIYNGQLNSLFEEVSLLASALKKIRQ